MEGQGGLFYVNSFPRSGNTWVRQILIDILKPMDLQQNPIFINLFKIFHFHRFPRIRWNAIEKSGFAMIKSHGRYETTRMGVPIIYLVRDGRDSMISYYHFNAAHRGYAEDFNDYFDRHVRLDLMNSYRERRLRKFMGDWSENALSYLNRKNVLIIHYEDLRRDALAGFHEMLHFLGVKIDQERIERALELGRVNLDDKNARHKRPRGASRNWENMLNSEQNQAFLKRHQRALEEFGYSPEFIPNEGAAWPPTK